ncbi:hypothetical protein JZ751_016506 [Albula glossodonta]|uniref:Uncharacterized protein n=1 Tax=Albula glossodonta TaxID=121402 RepID=A0A8T2NNS7_9TELE|nr:hypothetical protein JZ751_016506 [Albula glossodonta]
MEKRGHTAVILSQLGALKCQSNEAVLHAPPPPTPPGHLWGCFNSRVYEIQHINLPCHRPLPGCSDDNTIPPPSKLKCSLMLGSTALNVWLLAVPSVHSLPFK